MPPGTGRGGHITPGVPAARVALNSYTLRQIADGLESLAKNPAIKVASFEVHGYIIHVRRTDSQMDGTEYIITRISAGSALGSVMRGLSQGVSGVVFDETSTQ